MTTQLKKVIGYTKIVLLCLITTSPAMAKESDGVTNLKRLFTSIDERVVLDKMRKQRNAGKSRLSAASSAGSKISETESTIVINGFIKRSDGEDVVWINDFNSMNQDLKKKGISVQTGKLKNNHIQLSVPGKKMIMKPGQAFDISQGKLLEVYNLPGATPEKSDNEFPGEVSGVETTTEDAILRALEHYGNKTFER